MKSTDFVVLSRPHLAAAKHFPTVEFADYERRLAGMQEEDELRYLQTLFGISGFTCEFNITGNLWTSRVTSHVPLRAVAALITQEAVRDAVYIIDATLRRSGIALERTGAALPSRTSR